MLEVRRDREIHHEDGGWFQARWHFSFDRYRDPRHMGIGPLRVLNHDRLEPGAVWPMHPHADVEGITYVWKGTFKHADSLGNNGTLRPGGIQLMTLGSGALHSEQNGSESEPMEFIQIWILPDTAGLTPAVQQRQFTKEERTNRLLKVIGPPGEGVVTVHQNASIFVSALTGSTEVSHELGEGRGGYLYLIEGGLRLGKQDLSGGDAVVFQDESSITLAAKADGSYCWWTFHFGSRPSASGLDEERHSDLVHPRRAVAASIAVKDHFGGSRNGIDRPQFIRPLHRTHRA